MDLRKLIKGVGRSEKGFTLIELLVVVAILGVIAAVVILNIGSFIGSGTEESANTEAHQVTTAAIAYMQANGLTSNPDTSVGPTDTDGLAYYLLNPSRLQATYSLDTAGKITGVTTNTLKWKDCTFTNGAWTCP